MTSKQELEKLIENILEQGKVVTVNPDLILNINIENFIPIIQRACEELDRVEELRKDIVTTYESNKLLREENAKLKKVIDKACEKLEWTCPFEQKLMFETDCDLNCKDTYKECWKKYFMKEVLQDD